MADAHRRDASGTTFVGQHLRRGDQQPQQSPSTFADNYWDAYAGTTSTATATATCPFRPVRLFSLLVEQNEPALILLRSSS